MIEAARQRARRRRAARRCRADELAHPVRRHGQRPARRDVAEPVGARTPRRRAATRPGRPGRVERHPLARDPRDVALLPPRDPLLARPARAPSTRSARLRPASTTARRPGRRGPGRRRRVAHPTNGPSWSGASSARAASARTDCAERQHASSDSPTAAPRRRATRPRSYGQAPVPRDRRQPARDHDRAGLAPPGTAVVRPAPAALPRRRDRPVDPRLCRRARRRPSSAADTGSPMTDPVSEGPRWYRARIRRHGPLLALVPPWRSAGRRRAAPACSTAGQAAGSASCSACAPRPAARRRLPVRHELGAPDRHRAVELLIWLWSGSSRRGSRPATRWPLRRLLAGLRLAGRRRGGRRRRWRS